jgi:lysophospholipase L1-like esterase/predicted nucleic acid-binding Zn ribbon protein
MQDQQQAREQRREKIRKKKRRKLLAIAIVALVLVLIITAVVLVVKWINRPKPIETAQIGPHPPAVETDVASLPRSYDYAQPVPLSATVNDSYFADTLFIGDARLGGFLLYGNNTMGEATIVSSGSASVSNALALTYETDGAETSLADLLSQNHYQAVYITLGINELGWVSSASFIEAYETLLDEIIAKQPIASIYVHLITPVTTNRSASSDFVTNAKIDEYNALIRTLATEKRVYLLDAAQALCDGGPLNANYTTDGLHFNQDGMEAWYQYLKTHYVSKELYLN